MIKMAFAAYWKWRLNKNHIVLKELLELKKDCVGYGFLEAEMEVQIQDMRHLISQAEMRLLKYQPSIA